MADPRLPSNQAFNARDEFVNVKVGESKESFRVHKSILCSSSQYFKTKKKPEWSETGVESPYDSEEAFNIYVNWLYTRKIPTTAVPDQSHDDNQAEWKTLAEAYALGDAVIDTAFKDNVVDAMRAKVRSNTGHTIWSCGGEIIEVIHGLPISCPVRTFLVDIYRHFAGEKEMASIADKAPGEFFYDIVLAGKTGAGASALDNFDNSKQQSGSVWQLHEHQLQIPQSSRSRTLLPARCEERMIARPRG